MLYTTANVSSTLCKLCMYVCVCVCVRACARVCMYVCVCVCVCVYIYINKKNNKNFDGQFLGQVMQSLRNTFYVRINCLDQKQNLLTIICVQSSVYLNLLNGVVLECLKRNYINEGSILQTRVQICKSSSSPGQCCKNQCMSVDNIPRLCNNESLLQVTQGFISSTGMMLDNSLLCHNMWSHIDKKVITG